MLEDLGRPAGLGVPVALLGGPHPEAKELLVQRTSHEAPAVLA